MRKKLNKQPSASKPKGLSMGALQEELELSRRAWELTEKALYRAQETRDSALARFQGAEQAFRDGARTALG